MGTFAPTALCSGRPREGVMRQPPGRRGENILTRPMLWPVFTTAAFLVVVTMTLPVLLKNGRFAGAGTRSTGFPGFTGRQVSIFFTAYVLFQVWNEISCRPLVPDT